MFLGNVGNSVTMLRVPKKRSHSHTAMKTSRPCEEEEYLKEDEPNVTSSCRADTNKVYGPLLQCWLLMSRVIKLLHAIVSEAISRKLLICNYWLLTRRIYRILSNCVSYTFFFLLSEPASVLSWRTELAQNSGMLLLCLRNPNLYVNMNSQLRVFFDMYWMMLYVYLNESLQAFKKMFYLLSLYAEFLNIC